MKAGTHKNVLVIGADCMSRIIDYTDRATCILFGDGAGAMLVEAADDGEPGFIGFNNEIDGSGGDYLKMPAGGSLLPASHETVDQRLHYVKQDGQQVFKYAVRKMYEASRDLLAKNNVTGADVAAFIPHQANIRIINAAADRLGIDPDKVIINIEKYGNTTAATVPLATRDAVERRQAEERRPGCLRRGGRRLYRRLESLALGLLSAFQRSFFENASRKPSTPSAVASGPMMPMRKILPASGPNPPAISMPSSCSKRDRTWASFTPSGTLTVFRFGCDAPAERTSPAPASGSL